MEERRVIFAEPVDVAEGSGEDDTDQDVVPESGEEDIEEQIPVRKVRKFDEHEMLAAQKETLLTRHFKLEKTFGAAYTGG